MYLQNVDFMYVDFCAGTSLYLLGELKMHDSEINVFSLDRINIFTLI